MKEIKCPACGNQIQISDESVGTIQCKCGAVIPNAAKLQGDEGFQDKIDIEKIKEMQRIRSKRFILMYLIIYNMALVFLGAMLFVLIDKVDTKIPIFTITPVIFIMAVFEVAFLLRYKKVKKMLE